jgi:hypothetical protein
MRRFNVQLELRKGLRVIHPAVLDTRRAFYLGLSLQAVAAGIVPRPYNLLPLGSGEWVLRGFRRHSARHVALLSATAITPQGLIFCSRLDLNIEYHRPVKWVP